MSGILYWLIRRCVCRLIEYNFFENEVCVVSSNDLELEIGDINICIVVLYDFLDNDLVFYDFLDNDLGVQNIDDGELFDMYINNVFDDFEMYFDNLNV